MAKIIWRKSMARYEVVKIDKVEVSLDLSMFRKTEEFWFNATDIAKVFGKEVKDWIKYEDTREFFEALLKKYPYLLKNSKCDSQSLLRDPENRYSYLVKTTKGRYGGTLLHRLCAFEFGRWCSKDFAVAMDAKFIELLREEQHRKAKRLEAKTGYRPMTDAIMEAHDPTMFYHYSNEADLINKIITGKNAKQLKEIFETENIRECLDARELKALENLQRANTVYIQMEMPYEERKEKLIQLYNKKFSQEAIDNTDFKKLEEKDV